MALYNFHRVLIATSILFAFGFALYCFRQFGAVGGGTNLAMGVAAGGVAAGMIAYLIYFNLRLMRHPHHRNGPGSPA